ncbi:hypothetical protein AGR3A_Cc190012 [Agrobacterium tomkonis CFBP 6623]|uniref:Uncharacterized protein n=1 Tax=Agrobacterium tomkonis CFBP 6623 TaxID=1183432 RepID=A0A1S7P091_9HYPH|nr:hypothetical protein AGR3A_Cc190012 [Agrobacterium tomkonis CFBP 6623]
MKPSLGSNTMTTYGASRRDDPSEWSLCSYAYLVHAWLLGSAISQYRFFRRCIEYQSRIGAFCAPDWCTSLILVNGSLQRNLHF